MLTDTTVVEPDLDIQPDPLELLLEDREWLETEFAAIMNASGFGDRFIVGNIPAQPYRDRAASTPDTTRGVQGATRFRSSTSGSRVRSPPKPR